MKALALLLLMTSSALACDLTPALETRIRTAAEVHDVEVNLFKGVLWQESRFCHTDAAGETLTSPKGALGMSQLMPATAAELGVDPHNLEENLSGGARYLAAQLERFGSARLALAAYNAGPSRVAEYGGVPPFEETTAYVASILEGTQPVSEAPLKSAVLVARHRAPRTSLVSERTLTSAVVNAPRKLRSSVVDGP